MSVAAKMPERIWTELNPYDFPGFSPCWVWHSDDGIIDTSGVQPYIRADLVQAKDAELDRMRANYDAMTLLKRSYAEMKDAAEAERDELRAAIFGGPNYSPRLQNGNFVEMVTSLHAAQQGGLARAEKAEAELAAAQARVRELEALWDKQDAAWSERTAVLTARIAELEGIATQPDAELDALVARLEKLADDMEDFATDEWDESEDVRKAVAALRAQKGGAS